MNASQSVDDRGWSSFFVEDFHRREQAVHQSIKIRSERPFRAVSFLSKEISEKTKKVFLSLGSLGTDKYSVFLSPEVS